MASGEVVIQSMWSPAVTAVRAKGIQCSYRPLKEGYRAWGGGLGLAKHLSGLGARRGVRIHQLVPVGLGRRLPEPAGLLLGGAGHRQGEHEAGGMGVLDGGQAGRRPHRSPDGTPIYPVGAMRDGGSFYERMGHVACWNSVMDENKHMVQKWNEFVAA